MNEPLTTRYRPAAVHAADATVRVTYLTIPQARVTHRCVVACPAHMWGAEFGFNEHGLACGNEALFTKCDAHAPALTGMDLVRLALERARTALEAKELICTLLAAYGQGGNCGFGGGEFYYSNGFLLVDRTECIVLETVGREWACKRVTKGVRAMSNGITFGDRSTFDECSPRLIANAVDLGFCRSEAEFHMARAYSGPSWRPQQLFDGAVRTYASMSKERMCRATELAETVAREAKRLRGNQAGIRPQDLFELLRDHGTCAAAAAAAPDRAPRVPTHGFTAVDICMHAGPGPVRINQTTGALVYVLPPTDSPYHPVGFLTCTSLTCLSVFKPVWLLPDETGTPSCQVFGSVDAPAGNVPPVTRQELEARARCPANFCCDGSSDTVPAQSA